MQRRENNGAFASQHNLQQLAEPETSSTVTDQKVDAAINAYFNVSGGDQQGTDDDGATEGGSEGGSGSIAALGGGYYLSTVKPLQLQKQVVGVGEVGTLSPLPDDDFGGEVGSSSSMLKKGGIHDSVDSFRAVFEQQLTVNEQSNQIPSSSSVTATATETKSLSSDPLSINNFSNKEEGSSDSHDGYMDSPVTWDSPMTTNEAASSNVSSHHNTSPLPPTVVHYPHVVGNNMGMRSSSQLPPPSVVSTTQVTMSSGGIGNVHIGGPMTVDYNPLQSQLLPPPLQQQQQQQLPLPPHQQPCLSSSSGGINSQTLQSSQHMQSLPQQQQQHPSHLQPSQMCHFNNGLSG